MGLQVKMPSPPPLPQMGGKSGGQGEGDQPGSRPLWKVLLPLLWLLVPLGLYIASHYTPTDWRYWIYLAACILAAAVLVWVLVRLFFYLRERYLLRRQRAFLRRQDPLFVAAAKIEARVRRVLGKLASANLGTYGLPWYAVLGPNPEEVEAVLGSSGLNFPKGADEGLNLSPDQADRWHLANEAVFLDVSAGRFEPQGEKQRKLIWSVLRKLRPKEALSGALLILRVDELAEEDDEARESRLAAALESLRNMQDGLRLNFPVYVLATGLERVPGFEDFFSAVLPEDRGQILGWSDLGGQSHEFDMEDFRRGLAELENALHNHMLRHLAEPQTPKAAGRVFIFSDELDGLLKSLGAAVEAIFAPNRYLDPLSLRGAYLIGAGAEGPMVSFRPGGVPAGMAAEVGLAGSSGTGRAWFAKDLLNAKVLLERGLGSRPGHALRRDYLVKGVSACMLALVLVGGGWWMNRTTNQASVIDNKIAPLLQSANDAFAENQAPDDPIALGRHIMEVCQSLNRIPLIDKIGGLGRFESLKRELGQVHRAVFQEFYFKDYLGSVRDALRFWAGEGSFQAFAGALSEYIQWINPTRRNNRGLEIEPFVDFLGAGEAEREDIFAQFDFFMSQGGPMGPLVSQGERDLILGALERVQAYLNPSLPDQNTGEVWNRESQWWLEFSMGLGGLTRAYTSLLAMEPPDDRAPFEEAQAAYENLVDSLAAFLNQADRLHDLVVEAAKQNAGWIATRKVFTDLRESARGWEPVERGMEEARRAGRIYRRRIVAPLGQHLYAIQLLYGRTGFGWLQEVLSGTLSGQTERLLEPAHQVGPFVLSLFQALGAYHNRVETWANGYQTWKTQISSFQSIGQPARILRLDERQVLKAEDRVLQVLREMEILAGRQNKKVSSQAGLEKASASKKGKSGSQPDLVLEQVLTRYNWGKLDQRAKQWTKLIRRISLYHTALYWRELAAKFNFARDLSNAGNWLNFKKEAVFALGDGESLIEPISEFLRDWDRELPQDLLDMASPGRKTPVPPELNDFVDMHRELMRFKKQYLPVMRRAAINFVRCIHDMDLDPAKAWAQIWQSQGPGAGGQDSVTWGAIESLSTFRDSFEAKEGPTLESFTQPLVTLQNAVTAAFQDALLGEFKKGWDGLLNRYQKLGYPEAFPFYLHGKREISRKDLLDFFQQLQALGQEYSLLKADSGQAVKTARLYPSARKILKSFKSQGRLRFIQNCLSFRSYLEERKLAKPRTASARLIPGEIGRHMHWVRLALGSGADYDLNVYGKPSVTILMNPNSGSVTLQGLDVRKNPLSSLVATKGDLALLQLPYILGATQDPTRKRWMLEGQVPSVESPGEMVPFKMEMIFSEPLPKLPQWPNEAK